MVFVVEVLHHLLSTDEILLLLSSQTDILMISYSMFYLFNVYIYLNSPIYLSVNIT